MKTLLIISLLLAVAHRLPRQPELTNGTLTGFVEIAKSLVKQTEK